MRLLFLLLALLIPVKCFSIDDLNLDELDDIIEFTIVTLDVDQGDSTLIISLSKSKGVVSVLIDSGDIPNGGDTDGGSVVLEALGVIGLTNIDYVISTHYDADHIGGLVSGESHTHGTSILDSVTVTNFVDRGDEDTPDTKTFEKYLEAVETGNRISLDTQEEVDEFSIDLGGGARIYPYSSNGYVRGYEDPVSRVNTENERSLTVLIDIGRFEYLICGDVSGRSYGKENAKVESLIADALVRDGHEVEIVHIGHHGANNSSSEYFLEKVDPKICVISVGKNTHGHPHLEALERIHDSGVELIYQTNEGNTKDEVPTSIEIHRNIEDGLIMTSSDGLSYEIQGLPIPLVTGEEIAEIVNRRMLDEAIEEDLEESEEVEEEPEKEYKYIPNFFFLFPEIFDRGSGRVAKNIAQ